MEIFEGITSYFVLSLSILFGCIFIWKFLKAIKSKGRKIILKVLTYLTGFSVFNIVVIVFLMSFKQIEPIICSILFEFFIAVIILWLLYFLIVSFMDDDILSC